MVREGMKEYERVEERLESGRSGSNKTDRQKMVRRRVGYNGQKPVTWSLTMHFLQARSIDIPINRFLP